MVVVDVLSFLSSLRPFSARATREHRPERNSSGIMRWPDLNNNQRVLRRELVGLRCVSEQEREKWCETIDYEHFLLRSMQRTRKSFLFVAEFRCFFCLLQLQISDNVWLMDSDSRARQIVAFPVRKLAFGKIYRVDWNRNEFTRAIRDSYAVSRPIILRLRRPTVSKTRKKSSPKHSDTKCQTI